MVHEHLTQTKTSLIDTVVHRDRLCHGIFNVDNSLTEMANTLGGFIIKNLMETFHSYREGVGNRAWREHVARRVWLGVGGRGSRWQNGEVVDGVGGT